MNPVKPANPTLAPDGAKSKLPVITPLIVATGIFNIIVPLFFLLFAWQHSVAFVHTLRISNLIILTKAVLDFQFYVRKSTAPFVSTSPYAWLIALCGSVTPLMFRPTGDASDFWVATMIQVIGGAMQIHVITTFNRSFGMAVARRGIKRDGLCRFVRHPFYLTFMISQFGYVLNHTSFYNVCILAFVTFFQILRINEEERLLIKDEEYQEYVRLTPWRAIPGVF